MPKNIVIAMTPMMAKVSAALVACGRRNAGTPFEIASTPVSAGAPEEKALSTAKSPMAVATVAAFAIGSTGAVAGQPPTHWYKPIAIVARIAATNPYGGIAHSAPELGA